MFKLAEIYLFFLLVVLSFVDIKAREIPIRPLFFGGILGVLLQVITNPLTIKEWLIGIIIGCFFLFVSKVSKEGIGYGDSILLFIMALCLGGTGIIITFIIASMLVLFVAGMLLASYKKISRNYRLPFYPFLTVGYFIGNWLL
ncbi:MAG TPA: prepilin peptidase [Candidatus Dorea intestinavium]|nr:prepilin peptidase [Candidatus Dorea intestinavium]